jgi:hypothetical protein
MEMEALHLGARRAEGGRQAQLAAAAHQVRDNQAAREAADREALRLREKSTEVAHKASGRCRLERAREGSGRLGQGGCPGGCTHKTSR